MRECPEGEENLSLLFIHDYDCHCWKRKTVFSSLLFLQISCQCFWWIVNWVSVGKRFFQKNLPVMQVRVWKWWRTLLVWYRMVLWEWSTCDRSKVSKSVSLGLFLGLWITTYWLGGFTDPVRHRFSFLYFVLDDGDIRRLTMP